jgi:LAO/AO transport system kinase
LPKAPSPEIEELIDPLLAGDRAALSKALNLVDDRRPEPRAQALWLLDALALRTAQRPVHRIGVTGAPGSGKSSLLNAMVEALQGTNHEIAILAVDPSSQQSGGALLGDRMRLGASARERGVLLRSMAARDRLGGLADATFASTAVLSAAFDRVFVETVGVGQSECDVAELVDTLVFVAQPGAGDMLQFMKAGILELPDVFVVNKSDMGPLAERTRGELGAGLDLGGERLAGGWHAPVLLTSARDRIGIDELLATLAAHLDHLERSGELAQRRARANLAFVRESLIRRYGEYGLERIGGLAALQTRLSNPEAGSPFRQVRDIGAVIEQALGGSTRSIPHRD